MGSNQRNPAQITLHTITNQNGPYRQCSLYDYCTIGAHLLLPGCTREVNDHGEVSNEGLPLDGLIEVVYVLLLRQLPLDLSQLLVLLYGLLHLPALFIVLNKCVGFK